jgi:serine/threonine protein kinase
MRRSLFDLHVGEAFGRYELMVPVAEGGMSRVWAARLSGTRGFQKVVGIKTLATEGPDRERLEKMLLAEARLAAQIHHPNVAQYLDLGERNGVLFVVMEWVDGESLTALLKHAGRSQPMPLPIAAQIVAQACNGLHGAHELCDPAGEPLGLVHCDVSPHNLMISASGAVKLIDFGIASATRGAPMAGQQGLVAGKLAFMAPEQARGYAVDRRADVFSLGIVLYLLTTGRHPFGFGTPGETLQRILRNAPVIPPCAADPDYPAALERIVLRALAHDREHRFATTAEMLYELSAAVPLAHEMEVGQYLQAICGDSLRVRRTAIAEALEQAAQRDDRESSPLPLLSVAQKPAPPPS